MELDIWPGDFGLPSIDVSCLHFLACSKFCASPITYVTSTAPWNSPTGEYPVCVDRKGKGKPICDFDKFVEELRTNGQAVVIDGGLTPKEKAQIDAFACFLQQRLQPAVNHTLWADDLNYHTTTHYWYTSKLSFPYNLYYVERRRKRVLRTLANKNVNQMMLDALQALNMLSAKLGDNKYFYGDKPTSLDALVFGYLAVLLRVPLPNDRLQVHLSACPNLVRFVELIISIYLPSTDSKQSKSNTFWQTRVAKAIKQKEASAAQPKEEEAEDLPIRDAILFGLGALTLSLIFAVHSGIIEIQMEEEENPIVKD
ncbi:unnamed protein product, partial [Mesorhabditis belari]|uniref:GST C-terminal domain-containing protein n=1 Tax=Mesorhabditis belari TaxID=2138241 RepID=A0AAF3EGA1_9BILA